MNFLFKDHRNYDINTQMASHCSLRSDYCQQVDPSQGYTNSLSSDTLWDPKNDSCIRQQQYKQQRPSSVYHQPTTTAHSYIHRYVHPSQVQPVQSSITTTHAYIQPHYTSKPKSWDNLAGKNYGGYAIGYVVNNSTPNKHQMGITKTQSMQQHPPPLPRKAGHAPYGRYSTFADVENYIPAPSQYVQEAVITKTIITTTKSTENLINNAQYNLSDGSCECITQQPSPKQIMAANCMACNATNTGYYSNLTRNNNRCIIPTKTEITRL